VGLHPKILVLSHDGSRLFAANWGSRDVTELDTATGSVVRTLAAGDNPRGMAVTRSGRLYIANFNGRSIDVYDGAAMQHHHRLDEVCRVPRHLVLSPDERYLYITCFTDSWLAVMDTASERIIHRVQVGRSPKADDVTADGRYVITADYGGNSVTIVDTNDWSTRTADVPGLDAASGIVCGRTGMRFFVTGWYDDHLYSVGIAGTAPHYAIDTATRQRILASRESHRTHGPE
jgi:YVTN family beta-propeller protein